ncbi:hypothetical protein HY632_01005 [Candidatus Uhrbacteria bacterium]|nr:hypothetical protein [Candidatus Uhrbacteria bacterium]
MGIRRPDQFEFPFLRPPSDTPEEERDAPASHEAPALPVPESSGPYRPTAEEEQEATRMFYGEGARRLEPKTRSDRRSERERGLAAIRAIRDMLEGKRPDLVESPEETIRRLAKPPPKKKPK